MNRAEATRILRRELETNYGGVLRFGFIGYPPFVVVNSPPAGPGVDYLERLAGSLELRAIANEKRSSWTDFENAILDEQVFTVAEPVIPTLARRVAVVPYMTIDSCMLISARRGNTMRQVVARAQGAARSFMVARDSRSREQAFMEVSGQLREAAALSGDVFAVVDGTYEEDVLQFFGAPTRSLRNGSSDIVELARGVVGDVLNGKIGLVVDGVSLAGLTGACPELTNGSCSFHPLFGNTRLGRVPAGMALAPWHKDLGSAIVSLARSGLSPTAIPEGVTEKSPRQYFRGLSDEPRAVTAMHVAEELASSADEYQSAERDLDRTTRRVALSMGVGLLGAGLLGMLLGVGWVAIASLFGVVLTSMGGVMFTYEGLWSHRPAAIKTCLYAGGLLLFVELLVILKALFAGG